MIPAFIRLFCRIGEITWFQRIVLSFHSIHSNGTVIQQVEKGQTCGVLCIHSYNSKPSSCSFKSDLDNRVSRCNHSFMP